MNASDHRDHPAESGDPRLEAMLGRSALAYRSERAGLADRIHAASVRELPAPRPLHFPAFRRVSMAALAACVLVACSAALFVLAQGRAAGGGIRAVRSAELAPAGGAESLLVALIDEDAALRSTDGGAGFDASAVVLTSGRSVDDLTVELEDLLEAGGRQ